MKVRTMLAGAALALAAGRADAQCSTQPQAARDACTKAVDLFNYLTPQLATALAGGSHTLGQGGTLAGLGHVAVDLRVTGVQGSLPKLGGVGLNTGAVTPTTFASDSKYVPMLTADAAIGIWRGYSLGVTHVGGLDALVSATYLRDFDGGDVQVKLSGDKFKFGYGVRLGLLEESLLAPGVSVSYLKRDLPTVSVSGSSTVTASGVSAPGTLAINDFALKTTSWRVTASKNFMLLGLSAGFGGDKYEASSTIVGTVVAPAPINTVTGSASPSFSMTRTNYFVGLSLDVLLAKVVAEAGQVTGGTVAQLTNNFGSAADKARTYLTVGLRFGL
jgi:hypothetical protein